jgi:ABC-type multidrug transport system ATPase subunit
MIEARGLVKHYRSMLAVDNLIFNIHPGTVTGFLGPNGVGKPNPEIGTCLPGCAVSPRR